MLDRAHRLTNGRQFQAAVRRGRRAASTTVVLHLLPLPENATTPPRVGLVVGKGVGNAVTRNRVKRRLRALARDELCRLPAGAALVVRALPAAATATYDRLGTDVESGLRRILGAGERR